MPNGTTKSSKEVSPNLLTPVPDGTTLTDMVANNKTAPVVVDATAGASIRPTEAVRTATLIMAPARVFRKGDSDALPSLPNAL